LDGFFFLLVVGRFFFFGFGGGGTSESGLVYGLFLMWAGVSEGGVSVRFLGGFRGSFLLCWGPSSDLWVFGVFVGQWCGEGGVLGAVFFSAIGGGGFAVGGLVFRGGFFFF